MASHKKLGYYLINLIFLIAMGFFFIGKKSTQNNKLIIIILSLIFLMILILYTECIKPFEKEKYKYQTNCPNCTSNNNWEITPAKFCTLGPYTWQGSSPKAKYCRELAKTKEGKEEIDRFECNKGFIGMPRGKFKFSPLSNSCWQNDRKCDDICFSQKNDSILL